MNLPKSLTRHRWFVAASVICVLASGCTWYFYPADTSPEVFLHDTLYDIPTDGYWNAGTEDGTEPQVVQVDDRLEIYGPRHFLRTRDNYQTDLTIILDWSVTNGDYLADYPAPNDFHSDFAIELDESGVIVELLLFRPTALGTFENTIRITDVLRQDLVDPVTVEASGPIRGELEVLFARSGDFLTVGAVSPELGLQISGTVVIDSDTPNDSAITLWASGLAGDPRCLEEVLIMRRSPDLGDLL